MAGEPIPYGRLFKIDSKGQVRVWWMERLDGQHRTCAGLLEGRAAVSDWTVCTPKNVGRSNATTPEQQAHAEIEAEYAKKLARGYSREQETAGEGAPFRPMLANKYEAWPGFPVYCQPKLDGIRCIAKSDGLWSRQGKPIKAVPHIWEALEPLFDTNPGLILDGELYNHELREDFNTITSLVKRLKPSKEDLAASAKLIEYHVYDVPTDASVPFSARNTLFFPADGPIKRVVTHRAESERDLDAHFELYLSQGYEGQMIRVDGAYEHKRSKLLLKRKNFLDGEFEIVRIEPGLGNWSGAAKRVVLKLPDGREFGAGLKGSKDFAESVLKVASQYPGQWATVRYFALTPDGVPRFPVAVELGRTM